MTLNTPGLTRGIPVEGAWDTSSTWFRDCYQDAGIPCAFQVFRPFQPLHTPVRGEPPGLLENQGCGSALAEGGRPSSNGVRVPFQCFCRRRCRPALGQQQDGVPTLPLPGRGRQNHPPAQILDFHLPLFQKPLYLPHAHHQIRPRRHGKLTQGLRKFTLYFCAFHLGFGLVLQRNRLKRDAIPSPRVSHYSFFGSSLHQWPGVSGIC